MVVEWVAEIAVLRMRPHSIQSMKNVTVAQFNQEIKRVKIEFSTLNNIPQTFFTHDHDCRKIFYQSND
jgi:hypothetical protein